ncbi:hypothetical protein [Agrobacterium tumefaciens]|uniref:hypothetical protein n=1 Tax=Agrobacterium tumefaciens TaxID=358 RepID=UPI00054EC9EA|nr:hypothetical protein [Agrobacterium tumefaciens]
MQNEKCKSCFECTETVIVKVRDDRNSEWRDSSVRRCANDQCWHIVDGTRADRLTWISNVYDYKYFGDYELSHEQLAAVYEAKSLAALSAQVQDVAASPHAVSDELATGIIFHALVDIRGQPFMDTQIEEAMRECEGVWDRIKPDIAAPAKQEG